MLRIAVTGVAADDLQGVGRRLRGAVVEDCRPASGVDPAWESADAVACFGATAHDLEFAARSLDARKHVLIAVRAGLTIDRLEQLAAMARNHDVTLAVENPDHALPSRRLIRQQIENGKLGEVGLLRIQRGEAPAPAGTRSAERLPDTLIGDIELAVWLVGRAPDTVYALQRSLGDPETLHGECIQVHLGFPHGGMGLITWSSAWPQGDAFQSLSVIAMTGAAYADEHQNRQLLFDGGRATAPIADEGSVAAAVLQEFVDRLPNGPDRDERLDAWRRLAGIVAAVEQSIAAQQAVPVKVN